MDPTDVPILGALVTAGTDDSGFDLLLLLGPVLVVLIVLLGRTPVTTGLAAAYVATFPAYVAVRAVGAFRERKT